MTTTTDRPPTLPTSRPLQPGRPGSDARLAVLHHLAAHPAGALTAELLAVISLACGRPLPTGQAQHVLATLRDDKLLDRERAKQGGWRWFSPASRQAARIRGMWRPAKAAHARHPAALAAHALAAARGLGPHPTPKDDTHD